MDSDVMIEHGLEPWGLRFQLLVLVGGVRVGNCAINVSMWLTDRTQGMDGNISSLFPIVASDLEL